MRHRLTLALTLAVLLFAAVACGDDDSDVNTETTTTRAPGTGSTDTTDDPDVPTELRVYFLRDEKVAPAARTGEGLDVAADALEQLLAGPDAAETDIGFSSAIPDGTDLLGVDLEDGVATVDLSREFASGGGSFSMQARVAQVVFTLTQFRTVDAVAFELEGEPVEALGGEGLILDDPQTRADWEDLAPAILVESPLPFEEVTSPLRITGSANTFEAAFVVNVTDGEGLIVYDEPAMATSGTGTRGAFDVTATFEVPRPGFGAVIVFEESAEDGRPIHVVEIPVQLPG